MFIDDWKGAKAGLSSSPIAHHGRLFLRSKSRKVGQLLERLARLDAHRWHASDNKSLFDLPEETREDISRLFSATKSHGYATMSLYRQATTQLALKQWDDIVREPRMSSWPKNNPYAVALVRFILLAHLRINEQAEKQSLRVSRVLFVCDRQDWLKARRDSKRPMPGFVEMPLYFPDALLVRSPQFSVWVCSQKDLDDAKPFLSMLSLVDAEFWAFGRFMSGQFSDGSTPHERLSRWAADPTTGEPFMGKDLAVAVRHVPLSAAQFFFEHTYRDAKQRRFHTLSNMPGS